MDSPHQQLAQVTTYAAEQLCQVVCMQRCGEVMGCFEAMSSGSPSVLATFGMVPSVWWPLASAT